MQGRKPKNADLIDSGSFKKSKESVEARREAEEALRTSDLLLPPEYLSPLAKIEWDRLLKLYRTMDADILSDLDIGALTIYCEAYAIYMKAHEVWVKFQQVVNTNPDAQKIIDKSFAVMEKQSNTMYKFSEQLCLTPIGRARMGMAKKGEPSLLEKLMLEQDE
jgi:P27 family predicted phage terminase small subunit